MDEAKAAAIQIALCCAIYLLAHIALGIVFVGWAMIWEFF